MHIRIHHVAMLGSLFLMLQSESLVAQESGAVALPRVGRAIDKADREYFALFRDVDDFARAQLSIDSTSIRCVVARENDDTLVLGLSRAEYDVLVMWLRAYERLGLAGEYMMQEFSALAGTETRVEKLRALSSLHARGIVDVDYDRFETVRAPLIVTQGGDSLHRTVLAVSESSVFLWDDDSPYDAADFSRHVRGIPFDSVRAMQTVASVPFGPATVLTGFAIWAVAVHAISRQERSGDTHDPSPVIFAPFLLLPAAIAALPLGAAATAIDYPVSYLTDDDTLAVKRAASRLLPHTLFGANVPPEFRRPEIAGGDGMIIYAHDDRHRFDALPNPAADFQWQVGIESLFHIYDVYYRPVSAHIGLSVSRRFRFDADDAGWYLALRPRLSAGTMLTAELALLYAAPERFAVHAGVAWTHAFETIGNATEHGNTWTKRWYSSYERHSLLQESFAVAGVTFMNSYGSVDIQFRRVLADALQSSLDHRDYYAPDSQWVHSDFGMKSFWGFGIVLSVGI